MYLAFAQGQPSPLPELPLQYGDYAAWQRRFLDQEVVHEQMTYWRHQLAGAPQVLALPIDRPRPPVQTVRGDDWMFPIGLQVSQKLVALCRQQRVTPFHGLLAAMAVLLAHSADVEDLLIGSPMSNRSRPGLEALIGLFVNTVVLRVQPRVNLTFNELLRQVCATTLDAFEHQDLPLGMLIDEILEERNPSVTPLFQVMIAHQTDAMSTRPYSVELPEDMGEGMRLAGATGTAKYDLVLSVMESDRGLLGTWEYNVDLFEDATILRLGRRYRQLLEMVVEEPHRTLGEVRRRLAALDQAERGAPAPPPQAAAAWSAVPPSAPTRAAPAAVSSTPASRQEAPGVAWPWQERSRGELRAFVDRLTEAEADRLLAEVVVEVGEETLQVALESLSAEGDGEVGEAARLLARLDHLSNAEVDGLLNRLLSQGEQVA